MGTVVICRLIVEAPATGVERACGRVSPRWRVWPCAGGWHPVFRHAPASGLGACPCAAASERHVATCAAIADRPVRVAVGWTGRRAEWIALDETAKGKGASLVGRGPLLRGRMILEHWVRARAFDASSSSDSVQAAKREIARIERAILEGDDHTLDEYGDLQAGLERIVELKERQRTLRSRATIDCFATWRSTRLPGGWS